MHRRVHCAWLSLLVVVPACGGKDSSSSSCGGDSACGGDVVGAWRVEALCTNPGALSALFGAQLPAGCEAAVERLDIPDQDLTIEYTAAGMRRLRGSADLDAQLRLSEACLAAGAGFDIPSLSDSLCQLVGQFLAQPLPVDREGARVTCSASGDACSCELAATALLDEMAPYTLEGNQIVETGGTRDYCVSGDRLRLASETLGRVSARRQ